MSFLNQYKKQIVYFITIICSIAFLWIGYTICRPTSSTSSTENINPCYQAKVISIDDATEDSYSLGGDTSAPTLTNKTISFTAIIKNGPLKTQTIQGTQYIDSMVAVNPKELEIGDSILVTTYEENPTNATVWDFVEYDRILPLIGLCIVFFLLLLWFGGKKGINTIISLLFTCMAIFFVFIPSIQKGYSIYISTTIVSIFIVFMSLLLLNGANIKTLCAILGNLGGLFVSGILALFMNRILLITGLVNNDTAFLILQNTDVPIDLKGIVWSGILIGSLGAIMDVAMSIASALQELAENMHRKRFGTMLRSGLNIGRDAMGTMTNTLILAYIGSSLAMVLLIIMNQEDLLWLFNLEMIVVEILQALVGSIGILCAIPITSLAGAYLYNLTSQKKKESEFQDNL